MSQPLYKPFIDRVIQRYEGGYCWDSHDPGGPTNFGITCYDLAEHRHQHMDSMSRWAPLVRAMTLAEAEDIYAKKYATADRFNDLKPGADCVILDYGINSGVVRPMHVAQAMFGRPPSNVFDNNLVTAINNSEINNFIDRMCNERMRFLQGLRIWPTFGRGWTARVSDLRQYCHRVVADNATVAQSFAPFDIAIEPAAKAINHPEMLSHDTTILHPIDLHGAVL